MAKRAKGTGTLRKRADGRWEGRLYLGKDENGKNQYKTVTSKKKSECQNKLDKLIAEEEKRKVEEEVHKAAEGEQKADTPVQEEPIVQPKPVINTVTYEIIADPFQIVQLESAMREYGIKFRRV